MNVLLLGSGGREHALAWSLAASPLLTKLYAAPGNPGIAGEAECVPLRLEDHDGIVAFCREKKIDLVVVGPEGPLVAGIVDTLAEAGFPAFGPSQAAAQLEGSKAFTKELCAANDIPTAAFARFDALEPALAYLKNHPAPIVIKADGLAAGKGVVVAMSDTEAADAVRAILGGSLGAAGAEIVIEEFLQGEEASLFCLVHGEQVVVLGSAQDHKRAFDGDRGPNTGGMGAYSPAPIMTREMTDRAVEEIVLPSARALVAAGMPYVGVMYAGLMITADGPKLIEYNVRFGDPETQVLLPRLKEDLLTLLLGTVHGTLDQMSVRLREAPALTVVLAAEGYPEKPRPAVPIEGLDLAEQVEGVLIFHAGTRIDGDRLVSAGGRVLNVTSTGGSVMEARARAYAAVDRIEAPGLFCRRDIGHRAIARGL